MEKTPSRSLRAVRHAALPLTLCFVSLASFAGVPAWLDDAVKAETA